MNKLTTVEKLDKKQIEDFFSEALNIEKTWPNLKKVGENKTICLFFWEPSTCLLYTSPSPRDLSTSRMPSSA